MVEMIPPITREQIAEHYPDALLLEPADFDTAIVGIAEGAGSTGVVLYSPARCVQVLMDMNEWGEDTAREYFDFNIADAYLGEGTPMFLFKTIGEGFLE